MAAAVDGEYAQDVGAIYRGQCSDDHQKQPDEFHLEKIMLLVNNNKK